MPELSSSARRPVLRKCYFEERYRRGDRPDYSLPKPRQLVGPLPPMKVVTCFMAARAAGK